MGRRRVKWMVSYRSGVSNPHPEGCVYYTINIFICTVKIYKIIDYKMLDLFLKLFNYIYLSIFLGFKKSLYLALTSHSKILELSNENLLFLVLAFCLGLISTYLTKIKFFKGEKYV